MRAVSVGRMLTTPLPALGQQDLALALMVGLADHSVFFHALDQPGGAVIADLQPALDVAGRNLALVGDDGDRLVEQIVARLAAAAHMS